MAHFRKVLVNLLTGECPCRPHCSFKIEIVIKLKLHENNKNQNMI